MAATQELHTMFKTSAIANMKFYSLWKRTYWQQCSRDKMLALCAKLRSLPFSSEFSLRDEIVVDHSHLETINLAKLLPLDSLHDPLFCGIGPMEDDRFLLCRVLSPPAPRVQGFVFVAEDRYGNPFWVFSSAVRHGREVGFELVDEMFPVGSVFAVVSCILQVFSFTWDPMITCSFSSKRTVRIHDTSSKLLRHTPWFEAPCATALEWKARGNAHFAAQRIHMAVVCYTHGIALDSTIELLLDRTIANIKLGEWEAALADADAVLARDAAHRQCAMHRAVALAKLDRHGEAVDAWMRAAILNRDSPTDKAECTAGAAKALTARRQAGGVFDWSAIRVQNGFDLATYLNPLVHFAPSRLPGRDRGMIAREAIPRNTLILVESPLAVAAPGDIIDSLLETTTHDSKKRKQVQQLCDQPHIRALCESKTIDNRDPATAVIVTGWLSEEDIDDDVRRIFFLGSLFNHSCTPNCGLSVVPFAVVTLRDIEAGEELLVARVPLKLPRLMRLKAMHERRITCQCARCQAIGDQPFEMPESSPLNTIAGINSQS
jgi:hypothetical protein